MDLSQRELQRVKVIENAVEGRLTVLEAGERRGLLILGAGDNTIRLSPPLTISRDQADYAMDVLEECLKVAGAGS